MKYISVILSFLLITSCFNPHNSKVKLDNIEKKIPKVISKESDSLRIEYLQFLLNKASQNAAFIDEIEQHELKYIELLSQLDSVVLVEESYNDDFKLIFLEIDEFCIDYQNQVENFLILKNKLNEMASLNIIALRNTKWDYYLDVIELKVKIRNLTDSPIRKTEFTLKITDRNSNHVAIIPCKTELPIESSYDFSFIYDENAHKKYHSQLENLTNTSINYDYQFSEIVFKDKKITLKDKEIGNLFQNNSYLNDNPAIDDPSEFCPYIDDTDPLIQEVNYLIQKKDAEISNKYPYIYPFWKENKLSDFQY